MLLRASPLKSRNRQLLIMVHCHIRNAARSIGELRCACTAFLRLCSRWWWRSIFTGQTLVHLPQSEEA